MSRNNCALLTRDSRNQKMEHESHEYKKGFLVNTNSTNDRYRSFSFIRIIRTKTATRLFVEFVVKFSCVAFSTAFLVAVIVLAAPLQLRSQDLQYRLSIVDEGTLNSINKVTPLNYENDILPQPYRGNIGTTNLFLGLGGFSMLLNLSTSTDNLQSPDYTCSLRECAFDYSLSDAVDITIGKKILKWGTGYAFNPTGVGEPQRSPSDPSDRLGQNEGSKLASVEFFAGNSSLTFVYVNDSRIESWAWHWGTQEFAMRAYTFASGLDLSLVGHYREGDRLELGTNWSYVVGNNLELHGEFLGKQGSSALYHQTIATDDDQQIYSSYPYLAMYDHSSEIFYKFLVGGQFTFENGINIAIEFYRNTEGLSTTQWQRWMKFVKFQSDIQRGLIPMSPELVGPSRYNLLWALQTLSPRGAMQDYCFGREYWGIERWGIELIQFLNAQDLSAVIIPTVSFKLSDNFSSYGRLSVFTGKSESEFGALFYKTTFNLGIQVQI